VFVFVMKEWKVSSLRFSNSWVILCFFLSLRSSLPMIMCVLSLFITSRIFSSGSSNNLFIGVFRYSAAKPSSLFELTYFFRAGSKFENVVNMCEFSSFRDLFRELIWFLSSRRVW